MASLDDEIEKKSNILEFRRKEDTLKEGEFRVMSPLARGAEISVEKINLLEDFLTDLVLFLIHRQVGPASDPMFIDSIALVLSYHFLNNITADGLTHQVLALPSQNPEVGKYILTAQVGHPNKTLYPVPFLHCTFGTNDELVKDIFVGQCRYFFELPLQPGVEYETIEKRYNIEFAGGE